MLVTNSRTWPKRCDSQPVSGTDIALATAKRGDDPGALVRADAQVARQSPRCDTLAMDESSTFMKVVSDSATGAEHQFATLQRGECGPNAVAQRAAAPSDYEAGAPA